MEFIKFVLSFLASAAAGMFANVTYDVLRKWLSGRRK